MSLRVQSAINELRLQQDVVHCPITALAFYTSSAATNDDKKLYILAGEDAWLKVYSTSSDHHHHHQTHGRLRVFPDQSIHGISVSKTTGDLLIWGNACLSVVQAKSVERLIRGDNDVPEPYRAMPCRDWIFDARMSPYDGRRGVVVTAHNEVVPFTVKLGVPAAAWLDWNAPAHGLSLVWGEVLSLSKPILYSARLQWAAPDEVLVGAGTVFGEIVVWKCIMGASPRLEKLLVLTGHEGSIFGVAISPEVELVPGSGQKRRLLASCSDDRTVRIWDITESPEKKKPAATGQKGKPEEARETGFGGHITRQAEQAAGESVRTDRCLAVAIGHMSRIWHVRFDCDEAASADGIEVLSFGEDTTMQKWRVVSEDDSSSFPPKSTVAPNTGYPYRLDRVEKIACHAGKHIWSCDVTSDGPGRTCIVTGGADGKVTLLRSGTDRATVQDAGTRDNTIFSLDHVLLSLPATVEASAQDGGRPMLPPKSKKDGFLRYAFLSESMVLVSTVSGRILLGDLRGCPRWSEVTTSADTQTDLQGYNVVKNIAPDVALVGSTSGRLYVFRCSAGLQEIAQLPGKITDILCIWERHGSLATISKPGAPVVGVRLPVLVTVLGSTEASLVTLDITEGRPVAVTTTLSLALHMGFVVTAVGVCNDLLLLGSRKGAITAYQRVGGAHVHQTTRNDCTSKGGDAVTSIIPLPPFQGAPDKYVLTTCRDGKYRIYEVQSLISNTGTTSCKLVLRHETAPPLGPMLEGARLVRSAKGDRELIIFGFRSTNFVVWNETTQQEIANVPCGGAHRTFDYFSDPQDANRLRFVYTKASSMGIFSQDEPAVQVIRPGGHGREIRAVAADESMGLVATGAEDTCIRIWETVKDASGAVTDLRCRAVLQKHTAGLQALKWERNGYLLSSAGAEEFFVWKVTNLESDYKGLAVVCEAVFPFRSMGADLRIMDFDSLSMGLPEGLPPGWECIIITMVFSNSVLSTCEYREETGFTRMCTARYTGACLTQVRHIVDPEATACFTADRQLAISIMTGATDGTVALWIATKPTGQGEGGFTIVCVAFPHKSAVKSLEVVKSKDGPFLVFTGGDDNAVVGFQLVAERDHPGGASICKFQPMGCLKDAHAAAVTGVKFLQQEPGVMAYLATVSNDQRLKIWRLSAPTATEKTRAALLYNMYSALADPGGLEVMGGGKLMIGGVGMEVWDFFRVKKVDLL